MNNVAIMQDYRYTGAMSTAALGSYLFTLRDTQGLEPKDILPILTQRMGKNVDHSRLWRAENGDKKRWPDADFLLELIIVLGGHTDDLVWFQRNPDASAEQGRDRAIKRLSAPGPMSEEEREMVERLARLKGARREAARVILQDLLDAEERNG